MQGWQLSVHATSTHEVPKTGLFGAYGSVEANACSNCHRPHRAEGGPLLRDEEEKTCSPCHSGSSLSPPAKDVMSAFGKPYSHPVTVEVDLHAAAENAFPLAEKRHAECVDCHQPHSAGAGIVGVIPPRIPSALIGTSGFDGGNAVRPATYEYEVCFKCHADSPNKPQNQVGYTAYGHTAQRQVERGLADPKNLREKFSSTIARHNVTQPSRLSDLEVPSLRSAILYPNSERGRRLAAGTYLYCGDCHSSDDATRVGGEAADGPHGSIYPHLLVARYEQEAPPLVAGGGDGLGTSYAPGPKGSFALCNLCHDIENSILQDRSFTRHRRHVVDERSACATCHDPHGIQDTGGTAANNHRMVSFDMTIVGPDRMGRLYLDSGTRECYLSCHGVEHGPERY
jgi:predicted CXXCH cytochrome family protein